MKLYLRLKFETFYSPLSYDGFEPFEKNQISIKISKVFKLI